MTSVTASATAAVPAPAATVLLLRDAPGGRLEILMTQRASSLTFMGGLWVFPGGRAEPADVSREALERIVADAGPAPGLCDASGAALDRATARGLQVAACRETFEEAGVLLARPRAGGTEPAPDVLRRALEQRGRYVDAASFLQLLRQEDLVLTVERLVYWAHWITPSFEKRRFDTRFFAVRLPPGQDASVDRSETTRHAWVDEATVRTHIDSGQMKIAPPTLATLVDLWRSHRQHGGVDAMLEAERGRTVPAILPKIVPADDDGFEVVLPWDPGYARLPGEGSTIDTPCPQYLAAFPTRRPFKR